MKTTDKLVLAIWIVIGLVFVNNALAMEFKVRQYTDTGESFIFAYGPIEPGDGTSFEQFLISNPLPVGTDVQLHSPGGSVSAAYDMSYQIRNAGFNTWVPNNAQCWSACTDMFLGGIERTAWGIMGYHAASIPEEYLEGMTGQEILQIGQTIGIQDLVFAILMVTEGKEWKVALLYNEIHNRPDTSIFFHPSPKQLFDAGITTEL